MTTDWVTATKWPVGRKWLGPPILLSTKEEGDRQGCQWPQCGRGERRIRWEKICSSDKDSRTLFNNAGSFSRSVRLYFHHPRMSLTISIPPKNPSRLQAHQWKHSIAEWRIMANFTVCVQFRKQGGLPLPGAFRAATESSSLSRRGWSNGVFDTRML